MLFVLVSLKKKKIVLALYHDEDKYLRSECAKWGRLVQAVQYYFATKCDEIVVWATAHRGISPRDASITENNQKLE